MTPIMNTTPVHFGAAGFHATQFYSRKSHAPSTLDGFVAQIRAAAVVGSDDE